jgi:peroxiredoxin
MKKTLFLSFFIFLIFSCSKQNAASPDVALNSAAPEINLAGTDGSTIRNLSALKGKVVVVSFWASWCPYCRKDNPNLVKLYNKYKDKGLDIYSVSLDTDKSAWEKAIKDDGLIWTNHVSDFKKWKSPVVTTFGVEETPRKLLIDKNGVIKVLRFESAMEAEVEKLL